MAISIFSRSLTRLHSPGVQSSIDHGKPISRGLSGFWLLDESMDATSGGAQHDLVNRYNGANQNGTSVASQRGRVYQGNGTSSYVKMTGFTLRLGGTGVTMSAWVYSTNFAHNGMIIMKSPVNSKYALFCVSDGRLYMRGGGQTNTLSTAVGALANDAWHFVVGTMDASVGEIWIDGTLAAQGAIDAPSDAGGDLYVGCFDATDYFFNGMIANAMGHNRRLAPAEIQQLFVNPYLPLSTKTATLVRGAQFVTAVPAAIRFQHA